MKNIPTWFRETNVKRSLFRFNVVFLIVTIILLALLVFYITQIVFKQVDKVNQEGTHIIAWMNNNPIRQYELNYFIEKEKNRFLPILMKDQQTTGDIDWTAIIDDVKVMDTIKSNAAEQVMNYNAVLMKAKEKEIQLEAFEVKNISRCVDDDLNMGDNTYQQNFLARMGVYNVGQYLEMKKGEALTEKYKMITLSSLIITEEEISDYYKKHLNKYQLDHYDEIQVIFIKDREKGTQIYNDIMEHKISFETAYDIYCEVDFKTQKSGIMDPSAGKLYYQLMALLDERHIKKNETTNILMNFSSYIVMRKGTMKSTTAPIAQVRDAIIEELLNEKDLDLVVQYRKAYKTTCNFNDATSD